MNWAPNQIRRLRLRLGWSAAELARRLGCTVDLVISWETGEVEPDPEMHHHLGYLYACVEYNSYRILQVPMAEKIMQESSLAQVTHDTVNSWPTGNE